MTVLPAGPRVATDSVTIRAVALVVLMLMFSLPALAAEVVPEIPNVLRLEDAHRAALAANPERAAALWHVRSAEGRAIDQAKWPNPQLDAEVENWGTSLGNDILETTLGVSQRFEIGGDRGARAAAATSRTERAVAGLGFLESDLRERVTLDFVAAWVAQERFWMLRAASRIANAALVAAEERIVAGAASPVEKIRARNQVAVVAADVVRAHATLAAARRALALRWGAGVATFDSLSLPPPGPEASEQTDGSETALTMHPAIAGAEAEVAIAAAHVRRARAERIPDVDLRLAVRRIGEFDETAFVAGVTLPLPAWNSRGGELAAAQAEHARSQAQRGFVELRLRAELESARAELQAARQAYAGLVRDAMPAAREALATTQDGYRAGRYSYVELAEAQRAALETGVAVVESVAGVWRAVARLESLAGVALQTGGSK